MPFPSTLSSFTDPTPSDKLSTTPHSSIETAQNTGLKEIQAFIGAQSSLVGTLYYDIRAAGSSGGGHVQAANVGGTGQTAYTKGDILVATSSSVLTKLAVSANDNDQLLVNSSVAAGVNWKAGVTSGTIQNMTASYSQDSGSGSVYAIYPVPCVLSYADGQLFAFKAANANTVATPALSVSSLVAIPIKNSDGTGLYNRQIAASQLTLVQLNNTQSYFGIVSSPPTNTKQIASSGASSTISAASLTTEQTVFSVTVPGGMLGTTGTVVADVPHTIFTTRDAGNVTARIYYGPNLVASFVNSNNGAANNPGWMKMFLVANAATNVQRGSLFYSNAETFAVNGYGTGTASVDGTLDQVFKYTLQWSSTGANNKATVDGYVVNKI